MVWEHAIWVTFDRQCITRCAVPVRWETVRRCFRLQGIVSTAKTKSDYCNPLFGITPWWPCYDISLFPKPVFHLTNFFARTKIGHDPTFLIGRSLRDNFCPRTIHHIAEFIFCFASREKIRGESVATQLVDILLMLLHLPFSAVSEGSIPPTDCFLSRHMRGVLPASLQVQRFSRVA